MARQSSADVFTNFLDCLRKINNVVKLLGCEYGGGCPASAPQLKYLDGNAASGASFSAMVDLDSLLSEGGLMLHGMDILLDQLPRETREILYSRCIPKPCPHGDPN